MYFLLWFIFLFKQKTAYEMRISDWSSDVCSSDLLEFPRRAEGAPVVPQRRGRRGGEHRRLIRVDHDGQFRRGLLHRIQESQIVCHPFMVEADLDRKSVV